MKKIITALCMGALMAGTAMAQDILPTSLVVSLRDGNEVEYKFSKEPEVTFEGAELKISDINGDSVAYGMADVASFTFRSDNSGVGTVEGVSPLRIVLGAGAVTVSGLEPGAEVRAWDLEGRQVAAVRADGSGIATVECGGWIGGTYVIAAGSHSFKYIK